MFHKETALARALSIALVLSLTSSFGFFMLDSSYQIGLADPRLTPNGNYTSTVYWEFADPGNYTTTNIDLSNQEAKLTMDNYTWTQTNQSDFVNGTFDNTNATLDGKLRLSDLTSNAIANGDFSVDSDWMYQDGANGNISSQYSIGDGAGMFTHSNVTGISSYYERVPVLAVLGDGITVPGGITPFESLESATDAQYYRLDGSSSEYVLVQGFNTSYVPSGKIGKVVLWAKYRVDTVSYDSQTSVMCRNETGTFRRTDIIPIDGETVDIAKSFDITAFHSNWSLSTISSLNVSFQNMDTPPYAYVEFNSIWLDVFIEPMNETGSIYQMFSRAGSVGYKDTGQFDFNSALNRTDVDISSDPGNVTLSALSGRKETTTINQTVITGKDAYIVAGSDSKQNFGTEPSLMMLGPTGSNTEKRIVMQFDLASIPPDARVESAFLWLRMDVNAGPGWDISFYRLTTPWLEINVTWEDPWATFGGDFNFTSRLATTHIKYSHGNEMWIGWDFTDALKDWGAGNHTWKYNNFGVIGVIDNTPLLIDKQFHSSDTANTTFRPQLVVTHSNLTYAPSGSLVSRVYDAGQNVAWKRIKWTESTTPGTTSISVQTRTGSTDDPYTFPGTWETWMPISNYSNPDGDMIVSSPGRYLQYKVEFLTSHQNYTPILSDMLVRWSDVKLGFDYWVETLVNINGATLHVRIDNELVWSLDTGMTGWTSKEVDIGDVLVDDLGHAIWLELTLFNNNTGPTMATVKYDNVRITNPLGGEFLSPVFSPGVTMNWKNISWNETIPPGTSMEIRTRVGDTPIPDASWSPWSPSYSVSTGESISHPASTHIQYKITLNTTDPALAPEVAEVKIQYNKYSSWGMVQSKNFSPPDVIEWGIFNASASVAPGNDIKYFYSTNNGSTWIEVIPGFNMSSVAIPDIRMRAELTTLGIVSTPVLYEMNLTYTHLEPLDRIEMSLASWSGTADDVIDLDVVGRDRYDKAVVFQQFWSTTDPNGTVDANGLYNPGSVGIWQVYCNNSDDTISNYTAVTIGPGQMISVGITPWQVGTITTDNNITFDAHGLDSDGNMIAQAIVNWSLTSGIGVIEPGPSASANFTPTTPGSARVIADDGIGNINVTSPITVIPGTPADIAVTPYDPGMITTDDAVLFAAYGKDIYGNTIGNVSVNWSVIGGIGNIPPGPSDTAAFDPTSVGNGRIVADDGLGHVNSTAVFSVSAGQVASVQITPSYVEVGIGEEQNFTAQGYDSDGNPANLVTTMWTTDVGNIAQATATAATLQAQNTPKLGGWVNATHGIGTGSATVDVVEYLLSPIIQGSVPSQERPEDYGSWSLDLSGFASDPNEGLSTLMWNLKDYDSSLYTISGTSIAGNHILVLTTAFDSFGSDQPTLELINSQGFKDVQPIWINITAVNDYPIFSGAPDIFVRYDELYVFDYAPYITDIDNVSSDFSLTTDDPVQTTVQGLNVTFTYPQSMVGQTAYVRITVADGAGGSDSDLISVRISSNYPPTLVKLLPDIVINEGETLEDVFNLDDYIWDQDGDSLFFSFGYSHLTIDIDGDHNVTITAVDQWTGFENVTFRAVDPIGGIAEDTLMVQVIGINDPPEISEVPPFVIHYEFPFTFDLFPYVTDVDNDLGELIITTSNPDNVTVAGLEIILLYPEIWGGSRYPYTVPLTIFVSDGTDSSFQVVTVQVTDNYPPSVLEKLPDLTFDEDFQYEFAFDLDEYFMDADNDTLFFVSGQKTIVVTIEANHSVTIEAPLNWFGTEFVTFRAIDLYGALVEDTIQVDVRPVNDAPMVLEIPYQYVPHRQWTLDLTNYISDVDNDISELNITVDSQYVYAESMILFFDYPAGVNQDNITITVSDGASNTTRYILVVIAGNEPTDWLSSNWLLLLILLTGIIMAIGSGGYLLLKKPMIIEDLFLIHRNGMLIEHHTRRLKITVDHDILSGMLTAILEFARETFTYGGVGGLKKMDLGERTIFLDRGEYVTVAIVVKGEEPEDMSEEIGKLILDVEERYPEIKDWDGTVGEYKGLPEMLGAFVKGTYEKGFWRAGPKRIKTLLDERQKGNSNHKSKKNGKKNGERIGEKNGRRNGKGNGKRNVPKPPIGPGGRRR
jgi:hypothetical protein